MSTPDETRNALGSRQPYNALIFTTIDLKVITEHPHLDATYSQLEEHNSVIADILSQDA